MKRTASIQDIFRPLASTPLQSALTNVVQVADILDWVLQQFGRSEVWLSSFSISEEFLRRLYFITRDGRASAIHLILDAKATNKTLSLWNFMDKVITSTHLASNHSKVLLVTSARGERVTIITSQNLTRGNRNESYVITTDAGIFQSFFEEVQHITRDNAVPLSDILRQRKTSKFFNVQNPICQ